MLCHDLQEHVTQDLDNLKNDLCDVEAMESEAAERNAKMVNVKKIDFFIKSTQFNKLMQLDRP